MLRRNSLAVLGLAILAAWCLVALLAPRLAPYNPLQGDVLARLLPPGAGHPLGTDELGRDVLSRIIFGSRTSLATGFGVVLAAGFLGTFLGLLAGYFGGLLDELLMRLVDLFLAFPSIVLAMAIAAALGPSLRNSMIAMVIVWWPQYARLSRGVALEVRRRDFVEAATALGASDRRILWRVVLPNSLPPTLIMSSMDMGNAVITAAALSFLGLGALPPTPEWGAMVASGRELLLNWWVSAFPGFAILSVVLGVNFLGDGLRDYLDPVLRRQL